MALVHDYAFKDPLSLFVNCNSNMPSFWVFIENQFKISLGWEANKSRRSKTQTWLWKNPKNVREHHIEKEIHIFSSSQSMDIIGP